MTYQNELNTNERNNMSDDISYTHWIIMVSLRSLSAL